MENHLFSENSALPPCFIIAVIKSASVENGDYSKDKQEKSAEDSISHGESKLFKRGIKLQGDVQLSG